VNTVLIVIIASIFCVITSTFDFPCIYCIYLLKEKFDLNFDLSIFYCLINVQLDWKQVIRFLITPLVSLNISYEYEIILCTQDAIIHLHSIPFRPFFPPLLFIRCIMYTFIIYVTCCHFHIYVYNIIVWSGCTKLI
jgi:hypothetical protein